MRLSKLQGISIMDDTFRCSDVDRQIIDKQEDQVVIHWEVATSTPISPHYTHIKSIATLSTMKHQYEHLFRGVIVNQLNTEY